MEKRKYPKEDKVVIEEIRKLRELNNFIKERIENIREGVREIQLISEQTKAIVELAKLENLVGTNTRKIEEFSYSLINRWMDECLI